MSLRYLGRAIVHLDPGTYSWVDVKRFHANGSDAELLVELMADDRYHDTYAEPAPDFAQRGGLHGPYRIDALSHLAFRQIEGLAARQAVESWLDDPTPAVRKRVDEEVLALFDAGTVYRLPDQRAVAEHDWGWVVGTRGFHEFVVVDHAASTLHLIVASDD